MIAFVFCLYDGMSVYVKYAYEKIQELKQVYQNSRFIVIMDTQTAEECSDYFEIDNVDIRVFKVQKHKKDSKSILFLRFLPVFEKTYAEYDIVILDVHDDTKQCIKWIDKAILHFQNESKDMFFMYVHSPDESCIYNASLHKTVHTHRDAGFSVWKQGGLDRIRLTCNGKFQEFLNHLQETYSNYEYGADEVIFDAFLKNNIDENRQVLCRNKFISTRCCGYGFEICKKKKDFHVEGNIQFHGKHSMYVCARKDY